MKQLKLCAFADESSPLIDGQITALQKNGMELLEIRNVDGTNISNINAAKAREVHQKLRENGIRVFSVGSPYGKINISDDFAPHLAQFQQGLEIADILGAENIRLFSFYTKEYTPAVFDTVCERLSRFIEAAKGSGITLCHENEKGIYGDSAVRCFALHRALPKLKSVFDPANFIQCNQKIKEAWALLNPYVHYLHIKDATPDGKVVPAGLGVGELPYIIKNYAQMASTPGVITLEPHLKVFDGLKDLEQQDDKTEINEFAYPTNEAAFDAAADALKHVISTL